MEQTNENRENSLKTLRMYIDLKQKLVNEYLFLKEKSEAKEKKLEDQGGVAASTYLVENNK